MMTPTPASARQSNASELGAPPRSSLPGSLQAMFVTSQRSGSPSAAGVRVAVAGGRVAVGVAVRVQVGVGGIDVWVCVALGAAVFVAVGVALTMGVAAAVAPSTNCGGLAPASRLGKLTRLVSNPMMASA